MITRRQAMTGAAALTAATVSGCSPAFAKADPVVALWDELETARADLAEKVAISDACGEAVPFPHNCSRQNLRVSFLSKTYDEKADGTLVYRETTKASVDREWLEWALKHNASDELRFRQHDAMARLEKLEAEWEAAHEEWYRAELEVERVDEICDAIEDQIVETEATSTAGILYKVRLGMRRNDVHQEDTFTRAPFVSAIQDIERLMA